MDRQFQILEHLSSRPDASQRDLSVATGISLGQINSIIKKLCDDGLLRCESILKKKIKYNLTQRGIAERARHSNEKILTILNNYRNVKRSVVGLLNGLYMKGYREFVLESENGGEDIYEVIKEAFEDHFKERAKLTWGPKNNKKDQVVLNLDRRYSGSAESVVNVLQEINI